MKPSSLIAVAAGSALLALMALGDTDDANDGTLSTYCDMRQVWQESSAEYGWPEEASNKYSDEDC